MGCKNTPVMELKEHDPMTSILLHEWRGVLGLHDWTISVRMCKPDEMTLNDVDGECDYNMIIRCAAVRILKPEYYGDRISKYCAERILVHELLHCKFSPLDTNNVLACKITHQLLNDICTSLICAKYGLNRDWFNNIEGGYEIA